MRWALFNGSPRGTKSNTRVILEAFGEGMAGAVPRTGAAEETPGSGLERDEYLLRNVDGHSRAAEAAASCDGIVLAYPLYTDSMPAIVIRFLETLTALHSPGDRDGGTGGIRSRGIPAAFIVHSGFPDGIHTAHLPEIHREICGRLGFTYAGTLRKPGSEAVRLMPPKMQKRLFRTLEAAGAALVRESRIPPDLEDALVRYETPGPGARLLMRLMSATGFINMYWKRMLKYHGAWDRRFDAPYGG